MTDAAFARATCGELLANLTDILERAECRDEPTVVTRHGRKVAAVVPLHVLRERYAHLEADLSEYVERNPSDDRNSLSSVINSTVFGEESR
jgi:prevent-host-death family protein